MTRPKVPVYAATPDWPRKAAEAINDLLNVADTLGDSYVAQGAGDEWTAPTGTASRATFATYAGQTASNPPTQAEVQAIDDHLVILSQRVKALIDDLKANGALT